MQQRNPIAQQPVTASARQSGPRFLNLRSALVAGALGLAFPAHAAEPSMAQLAAEVASLKQQLAQVEQQLQQQQSTQDQQARQIASTAQRSAEASKTTIGGYGEVNYHNLRADQYDSSGNPTGTANNDLVDLRRLVLFVGHDFSDSLRLRSEIEFEHAKLAGDEAAACGASGGTDCGPGSRGEVDIEQAYLEKDFSPNLTARAGVFLMPIGIINESHEPPTFYGVERNPVEINIIPSTWDEPGVGLTYQVSDGLTLDTALTTGFKLDSATDYAIYEGPQDAAKAGANHGALTARLKWTAVPGLTLAASANYQSNISQGSDPNAGNAWLATADAVWSRGPFTLKALYAQWNLAGSGPKAVGADLQRGWYLEPSYMLSEHLGFFTRYNRWNNQAGSQGPGGTQYSQWNLGFNYWLSPGVVIKADYQHERIPRLGVQSDETTPGTGFNLGVGYQF